VLGLVKNGNRNLSARTTIRGAKRGSVGMGAGRDRDLRDGSPQENRTEIEEREGSEEMSTRVEKRKRE
jgi:hypothetical protein